MSKGSLLRRLVRRSAAPRIRRPVMTIRLKLRLSVLALAVTLAGNTAVLSYFHQAGHSVVNGIEAAERTVNRIFEADSFAHDYVDGHQRQAIEQWRAAYQQIGEGLERLESLERLEGAEDQDDETGGIIRQLSDNHQILGTIFDRLVTPNPSPESESIIAQALSLRSSMMIADLYRLSQLKQLLLTRQRSGFRFALWLSVVMTVLTGLFILTVNRRVLDGLGRLGAAADRIGLGDFQTPVGLDGADEFAQLGTAMGEMAHHLDEMGRSLRHAQKMEALGQLTGGVAHDFNNLLQVILSNLDLSLGRLEGQATAAGYLQNAIASAEQGAKLTDQLLGFARRQPLRPQPLALDRRIGEMISLLRRTLGERVAVEMTAAEDLWTALADPNQLQNALLNLAINARDAMPQGGRLGIDLRNATLDWSHAPDCPDLQPGDYVMLSVSDTGTGMPPDVLERVFEPFFTTKPKGSGTGLGLSMVYGFAKQSGGHVRIDSTLGLGTTVRLYLPRTRQAEALRPEPQAAVARGRGETILVAEDDDGVRASVVGQLGELGYRVLAGADADQALALLAREERIDLLFTDVVMPGRLNGPSLAAEARKIAPALPILYTSGYAEDALTHHGRLEDGVTLLSKPYRLPQLAQAVRATLDRSAGPAAPAAEEIPPAPQPALPAPQPPRPAETGEADKSGAPARLLLVDDDDMVRLAMTTILEQLGYHVAAAATPSAALELLDGTDLLITDLTLPEMDGLALARRIWADRPGLPVILASGHRLDEEGIPPGIAVLTKPFRPQDLDHAVRRSLTTPRP